jgi:transcriptional regulator GlxA family with amidase domain
MVPFDARPLHSAILGLEFECRGARHPGLMQKWTELVHAYFLRFARPSHQPVKFDLLWNRVASKLAADWNLSGLAREADCSKEHLRRLCQRHLGRSPMHQVGCLRLRYAAALLAATEQPIEFLARRVGYQNPFTFSNAFAKWSGWRPSEYRQKKRRKN